MACQQGVSASDVITYIGVPLAVLGVLPILWNAGRSFWIRNYLVSLLRTRARRHVSMTVDPAAGVVIVVLDKLEIRWQDVVRELHQKSLATRTVQQIDPRLVGCSWMGLCDADVPVSKNGNHTQRVVVDASLRFESQGLYCDRQTLVFLALAVGVDPYRNRLDGILEGTLTDTNEDPVVCAVSTTHAIKVQLLPNVSFSERRVFAWLCVMIVQDNFGVLYIPLGTVPGNRDVTRPPGFLDIDAQMAQLDNGGIDLESALRWNWYAESVFYGERSEELLPVPQIVLQAREDALIMLQRLSTADLETHLNSIFEDDIEMVSKVRSILQKTWLEMAPKIVDAKREGQKKRDLKGCQTCLHPAELCQKSTIIKNLHSTITLSLRRPLQQGFLSLHDSSSPVYTAARVWLGLSVIQLWRREVWESELVEEDRSWKEVAKPSFELLRRMLHKDETWSQQEVYIG